MGYSAVPSVPLRLLSMDNNNQHRTTSLKITHISADNGTSSVLLLPSVLELLLRKSSSSSLGGCSPVRPFCRTRSPVLPTAAVFEIVLYRDSMTSTAATLTRRPRTAQFFRGQHCEAKVPAALGRKDDQICALKPYLVFQAGRAVTQLPTPLPLHETDQRRPIYM